MEICRKTGAGARSHVIKQKDLEEETKGTDSKMCPFTMMMMGRSSAEEVTSESHWRACIVQHEVVGATKMRRMCLELMQRVKRTSVQTLDLRSGCGITGD